MGRGISRLQKDILRIAMANRVAEAADDPTDGADIYPAEILESHFAFIPLYGPGRHRWRARRRDRARYYSARIFSRSEIGAARYNAGSAATSRALSRLAARSLVVQVRGDGWRGYDLTSTGAKAAEGRANG